MTITLNTLTHQTGRTVRAGLTMDDPLPTIVGLPVAQGDVIALPRPKAPMRDAKPVPATGQVLVAGVHDHLVIADLDSGVTWCATSEGNANAVAVVDVPAGQVAWLMHTDEHGAVGLGAGRWLVCGQREQAAETRRIAD